jgi:hypothetical protein
MEGSRSDEAAAQSPEETRQETDRGMVSQSSSSICDEAGGTDPEEQVRPCEDAVCPDPVNECQGGGNKPPKVANRSDEPGRLSRSRRILHHTGVLSAAGKSDKLRSATYKANGAECATETVATKGH